MPVNFDFMGKINEFLCDACFHRALAHFMHYGPCSQCWSEGPTIKIAPSEPLSVQTICQRFEPRDEDQAEIAETFEALNG